MLGLLGKKCRSLLTDMGVESGLWVLPDLAGAGGRCFPESMPLADSDHMLHHTMLDAEDGFSRDNHLWANFDNQISGDLQMLFQAGPLRAVLSKETFGKTPTFLTMPNEGWHQCFPEKCPTYIKTRWHFAFDVLHWVAGRKQLIEYLEPASMQSVVGAVNLISLQRKQKPLRIWELQINEPDSGLVSGVTILFWIGAFGCKHGCTGVHATMIRMTQFAHSAAVD